MSGDSVEKVESSMFLDAFKKRGVEVLYFTEPIDEYVAQNLREYSGKSLQDITKEGVEFGDDQVFFYDHDKAQELCAVLKDYPGLCFEGHSTDYQSAACLRAMKQ